MKNGLSSTRGLDQFFNPRSIAVVGVSRTATKLGTVVYRNLQRGGFRGKLIAINPNLRFFDGKPVAPSITALIFRPDLVIVVTPAPAVATIVEECGRKGIRNVVVLSAGFAEIGTVGKARESALRELIRRYRINLLGPNCLGYLHGDHRINATFAPALAPGGSVTLISQSGAMAVAITDWARETGVGFRAVVSMGNKAGLSEVELLEYFGRDPKTHVLLFYLESLRNGQEFLAAARRVVRRKPVLLLKAGASVLGQRAAQSHTGALAESGGVLRAAFEQSGILQVQHMEDLFDLATAFTLAKPPKGNRVAIVTNAGGPSIMAADAVATTSLQLTIPSDKTQTQLRKVLPSSASVANPIDLLGDADTLRYRRVLSILGSDKSIDSLLVLLTPQSTTHPEKVAKLLQTFSQRTQKTVVTSFLGGKAVAKAHAQLRRTRVPHFHYPEEAIAALDALWRYRLFQTSPLDPPQAPTRKRSATLVRLLRNQNALLPPTTTRFLRHYGIPVVPERLEHSAAGVLRAAAAVGYPVALKTITRRALHKTDVGAVVLELTTPQELRTALTRMQKRFPDKRFASDEGWLVQPYRNFGMELFLGGKRDSSFGPYILIGLGGVDVELLKTVVTVLPPFTPKRIQSIIKASALLPFLTHRRGRTPVHIPTVAAYAARFGKLLLDFPEIAEVDVNPFFVDGKECRSADVRFLIAQ